MAGLPGTGSLVAHRRGNMMKLSVFLRIGKLLAFCRKQRCIGAWKISRGNQVAGDQLFAFYRATPI
jgi:hypothetical protein